MWTRPLLRIFQPRHQFLVSALRCVEFFPSRHQSSKSFVPPIIMPTPEKFTADRIFIDSLRLKCTCGPDAFGHAKAQPVLLSVDLGTTVARAAASDRVDLSIDYFALSEELTLLENKSFKSPVELMDEVINLAFAKEGIGHVSVVVQLEKGALMAKQVKWERVATIDNRGKGQSKLGVEGIEVPVIIGIEENTFERTQKQLVRVDLTWEGLDDTSKACPNFDIHDAVESIIQASIFTRYSNNSESISQRI